jgi:hypothetical protein
MEASATITAGTAGALIAILIAVTVFVVAGCCNLSEVIVWTNATGITSYAEAYVRVVVNGRIGRRF